MSSIYQTSEEFLPTTDICPECSSKNIIIDNDSGEYVCGACGLVVNDIVLSLEPEWRPFREHVEKRERVGPPLSNLMRDRGMSAPMDYRDIDSRGKMLKPERKSEICRWRKWDIISRYKATKQRNLSRASRVITWACDQLRLPLRVGRDAFLLYRRLSRSGFIRGREIDAIALACTYLVLRRDEDPNVKINLRQFATKLGKNQKKISQAYRSIIKEFNLKMKPPNPRDYIPRILSKLKLDQYTERLTVTLLERLSGMERVGKDPSGIAGVVIYISALLTSGITGRRITQSEVAEAAGITEVTLRNRYVDILRCWDWGKKYLLLMSEIVEVLNEHGALSHEELKNVIYAKKYDVEKFNDCLERLNEIRMIDKSVENERTVYRLNQNFRRKGWA
jgi:transcription initiation factor TFIIB